MTVLAIAPAYDTPGKRDATGAFLPEAKAYAARRGGRVLRFDSTRALGHRFAEVIAKLGEYSGLDAVAFFCHGWRDGLQCGATLRNASTLAWALRAALREGAPVTLYACDAGRDSDADRDDDRAPGPGGGGGFSSVLSGLLPGHPVDAHTTAGHATRNPHVRRFLGGGEGEWIVAPGSPSWRTWCAWLRDDPSLRFDFPFQSLETTRAGLTRG